MKKMYYHSRRVKAPLLLQTKFIGQKKMQKFYKVRFKIFKVIILVLIQLLEVEKLATVLL